MLSPRHSPPKSPRRLRSSGRAAWSRSIGRREPDSRMDRYRLFSREEPALTLKLLATLYSAQPAPPAGRALKGNVPAAASPKAWRWDVPERPNAGGMERGVLGALWTLRASGVGGAGVTVLTAQPTAPPALPQRQAGTLRGPSVRLLTSPASLCLLEGSARLREVGGRAQVTPRVRGRVQARVRSPDGRARGAVAAGAAGEAGGLGGLRVRPRLAPLFLPRCPAPPPPQGSAGGRGPVSPSGGLECLWKAGGLHGAACTPTQPTRGPSPPVPDRWPHSALGAHGRRLARSRARRLGGGRGRWLGEPRSDPWWAPTPAFPRAVGCPCFRADPVSGPAGGRPRPRATGGASAP